MLYYVAATRDAWLHAAASRSPAATTRRTTTASRWCWPAAPSTATRSRRLRRRMEAEDYAPAGGRRTCDDGHRSPSTAQRIVGDCRLARPMKIVVDSGNGIAGASAPAILRALGCEVIELYSRGRRRLPEPPSRPEQAREPRRPDPHACRPATPSSAWPSTATATGSASSRKDGNIIYPDRQLMLFAQRRADARAGRDRSSSTSSARSAWRRRSAPPAASR